MFIYNVLYTSFTFKYKCVLNIPHAFHNTSIMAKEIFHHRNPIHSFRVKEAQCCMSLMKLLIGKYRLQSFNLRKGVKRFKCKLKEFADAYLFLATGSSFFYNINFKKVLIESYHTVNYISPELSQNQDRNACKRCWLLFFFNNRVNIKSVIRYCT